MATPIPATNGSCCHNRGFLITNKECLSLIDKVCRLALTVFSAYVAPAIFSGAFALGLMWGGFESRFTHLDVQSLVSRACSQGLVQYIAGNEIPDDFGLIADFLLKWAHVDHHPTVYGLLVGVAAGVYIGCELRKCYLQSAS